MRTNRLHLFLAALAAGAVLFAAEAGGAQRETLELSLEKAVRMALENDELLRQAGEGVKGAEAGVREAKAGRLPSLTVSGQYSRNIRKPVMFLPSDMAESFGGVTKIELGEDNDFSANAAVSYNLWTAGRLSAGIGASSEMLEAVRNQESATSEYVRFQVIQSFCDVLLAAENLRIAEKALGETAEVLRITRAGFDQGTVSRFDLLRAEVEYENRQPQLVQARNGLEQSLIALRRRCGIGQDVAISLTDSLRAVGRGGSVDDYLELMRSGNPEISAVEHRVNAIRHNLRFERAERLPVLQLGANYLVQGQWSEDFLPGTNSLARSAAVTLGFRIPIFDGLKAKSRIDRARADLRSSELELQRINREKEMAVRASWLLLDDAITALGGRERAVELAEEAHRLALVRLANGMATQVERLDAELAMTTARAQLAQALYACNMAKAQLDLAVGMDTGGKIFTSREKENENE